VTDVPPDQAKAFLARRQVRVTNTPTSARISMDQMASAGSDMHLNLVVFVPFQKTDLSIRMIKGNLSITTLNGSIEANLEQGNVDVRDLAGYFSAITKIGNLNVELQGKHWTGYGLTAATHQGSINLLVPADYSAALQLFTKDGTVSVDFPDQLIEGEYVPLKVAMKKKAQSLSAPIGSGGAPIRLSTLSGGITLQPLPR
jgi:DUF4097 and DUF4098 domain-containing protein YvlB